MSAGDWGTVLGILANIRDEAHNAQGVVSDDDDGILPSLRYMEREALRAIALARTQTLVEAGA